MLEIKNITRVYNPKKGIPVTALDNVSLKFPEKGMIFVLGKSGSGKSTLLNVMGGLDKYDSGEIIIKGKSSKDFSQGDFDSYRNTYLGFIFQEYNILDEFTVGANIGLALQLQGKKATNNEINVILKDVDLDGYGNRKPNELSGGQKQRVAIARALVKNPEIILADEPTGALDSNTGLQVFDTLKKLSKEKLVIVVTHDREFAELYGDRVIEFKDGKVISDIEKYTAGSAKHNDYITVTDDKILQIKKGYELTAIDLKLINKFLAENDAIISVDDKTNKDVKKFARIDVDGNREAFKNTDESTINISEEKNFKMIKSHLPYKNSLKIGASSLKSKPVRLFFTILLSLVAFTLFGLADTMGAYDKYSATKQSLIDSGVTVLSLERQQEISHEGESYSYTNSTLSSDGDIAILKDKLNLDFKPVYAVNRYGTINISPNFKDAFTNTASSYLGQLKGFCEANSTDFEGMGYKVSGTLPASYEEIAISEYVFRHFKKFGYNGTVNISGDTITDENYFLNLKPTLTIGNFSYKITAIVDTKFDYEHFANLDTATGISSYMLYQELMQTVLYSYHGVVFVKNGFIDNLLNKDTSSLGIDLNNLGGNYSFNSNELYTDSKILYTLTDLTADRFSYYIKSGKTSIGNNEFIIDIRQLANILKQYYSYNFEKYPEWLTAYEESSNYASVQSYFEDGSILSAENCPITSFSVYAYAEGTSNVMPDYDGTVSLVGVYYDKSENQDISAVVVSNEVIDYFKESATGNYSFLMAKLPEEKALSDVIKFSYDYKSDKGISYVMRNGVSSSIEMINSLIETLSKVFIYIGIGFAVFAALMLTNFISTSISYKRREIGILRAVGARSSDVFGIFFNESLIIALINFILSLIVTILVVGVINRSLRNEYNLVLTILNFGFRQVGLMLALSVGVAFVASFIPVYRIAMKRPIDAMRKK